MQSLTWVDLTASTPTPGWATVPAAARDISLRAISQVTLHLYPGVEGVSLSVRRFWATPTPRMDLRNLGVDVPEAERSEIEGTVSVVEKAGRGELYLMAVPAISF